MALMIFMAVAGGVIGGVTSAQNYCKYKAQLASTIAQTNSFITSAKASFAALGAQDQQIKDDTNNLTEAAAASSNNLLQLRQNYVGQMKKLQIAALFVIVIVFALLLGKKLKLY
jgi:predicted PurR-regulated permease PerM